MILIRERVIHLILGLILRYKNTLKKLIMQLSMRLIMSILWQGYIELITMLCRRNSLSISLG